MHHIIYRNALHISIIGHAHKILLVAQIDESDTLSSFVFFRLALMILDNYPMVDMQNDEGDTPLHIAVRLDHKEIIRELESRGQFKT